MDIKSIKMFAVMLLFVACSAHDVTGDDNPPEYPDNGQGEAYAPDDYFNIPGNVITHTDVEEEMLIRNPCMGWGLYDDAQDYVGDSFSYWYQMEPYIQYATHFYVRWRWAEMEPEEGKYVWDDPDSNFNRLIKYALDKGLKLAFRVYYDSNGQHRQATPDYVRQAGAKGRTEIGWDNQEMWSPYIDDPVFHEKLEKFVKAFAEEFDDPDRVDFIDGFNLGYWGEGHDFSFTPDNTETCTVSNREQKLAETVDWITSLYGNAFKKVPLVINYHRDIGEDNLERVLESQDYQLRHDAFGSQYYSEFEKNFEKKYRGKRMIIAESCYWFVGTDKGAATGAGGYDFTEQWRNDRTYNPRAKCWNDVHKRTYAEAQTAMANTLDMREYREAKCWTKESMNIVNDFIRYGGYRLTPLAVSFPTETVSGGEITLGHKWRNSGFGICPNHNRRWNDKYKAAFAFVDARNNISKVFIDNAANPGDWLRGKDMEYKFTIRELDLPAGEYKLCIGISDTSKEGNPAGLNLACKNRNTVNGWTILGDIEIK